MVLDVLLGMLSQYDHLQVSAHLQPEEAQAREELDNPPLDTEDLVNDGNLDN